VASLVLVLVASLVFSFSSRLSYRAATTTSESDREDDPWQHVQDFGFWQHHQDDKRLFVPLNRRRGRGSRGHTVRVTKTNTGTTS
jgi:hypothetical protein